MSREFLFGKFYKDLTELEKEMIMTQHNEYEKNKNIFLLSIYDNEGTLRTSYNSFSKNVTPTETAKDKDLMFFTSVELRDLMNSITSTSRDTKARVYCLIDAYLDWCVAKGYILLNNLKGLDREELCKPPRLMATHQIISREKLYEYCEEAILTKKVTIMDCLPLMLARNGVKGEKLSRIINLKSQDIDRENNLIYVFEDGRELLFPVDKKLIEYIDEALKLTEDNNGLKYAWGDNVIRVREDYPSGVVDEAYINNKATAVFNTGVMPRTSFKILETCRKIDFLLDLREEKVLDTEDFKQISLLFKPKASASYHMNLVNKYKSITNDEVNFVQSVSKKIVDQNPKKTADEIRRQIGYVVD